MVLKGVNWVHNDKISLNGIERSQLGIQCKNQVIWSSNESIGYPMIKWSWKESIEKTMIQWGQMVLKCVNRIHNDKIRSNGLERSQLGKQ